MSSISCHSIKCLNRFIINSINVLLFLLLILNSVNGQVQYPDVPEPNQPDTLPFSVPGQREQIDPSQTKFKDSRLLLESRRHFKDKISPKPLKVAKPMTIDRRQLKVPKKYEGVKLKDAVLPEFDKQVNFNPYLRNLEQNKMNKDFSAQPLHNITNSSRFKATEKPNVGLERPNVSMHQPNMSVERLNVSLHPPNMSMVKPNVSLNLSELKIGQQQQLVLQRQPSPHWSSKWNQQWNSSSQMQRGVQRSIHSNNSNNSNNKLQNNTNGNGFTPISPLMPSIPFQNQATSWQGQTAPNLINLPEPWQTLAEKKSSRKSYTR